MTAAPPVGPPPMASLVRQGMWWGVFAGVGQQVASVATTVVLVRILAPSEFGIVVAANIVVAMLGLFTYLGIRLAIVRVPVLDEPTLWTLFWLSTGLGVVTSAAGMAAAGPLSIALGQPDATPFLRALSLLIVVQTLGGVPRALLQREMRFRVLYSVEIAAAAAQATGAIAAAVAGLGAWSLVIGYTLHATVLLFGFWGFVRRLPRLRFDRRTAADQVRFGAGMWTSSMLGYVVRNADFWVVSRVLGSTALGVYYIAYVLPNILRQRLTWVTAEVMLPSFASMQADQRRLAAVYARTLRLHAAVGLPTMAGLAVVSSPTVEVFFGSHWQQAAVPMAVVCLAAAFEFLTQPATQVLIAAGRTRTLVFLQVGRVVVLVPGCFAVVDGGGMTGVACAVLVSSMLTAWHAQLVCGRLVGTRAAALIRGIWPPFAAATLMGAGLLAVSAVLPSALPSLAVLVVLVPLGGLGYAAALWFLTPAFGRELWRELRRLTRRSRSATAGTG